MSLSERFNRIERTKLQSIRKKEKVHRRRQSPSFDSANVNQRERESHRRGERGFESGDWSPPKKTAFVVTKRRKPGWRSRSPDRRSNSSSGFDRKSISQSPARRRRPAYDLARHSRTLSLSPSPAHRRRPVRVSVSAETEEPTYDPNREPYKPPVYQREHPRLFPQSDSESDKHSPSVRQQTVRPRVVVRPRKNRLSVVKPAQRRVRAAVTRQPAAVGRANWSGRVNGSGRGRQATGGNQRFGAALRRRRQQEITKKNTNGRRSVGPRGKGQARNSSGPARKAQNKPTRKATNMPIRKASNKQTRKAPNKPTRKAPNNATRKRPASEDPAKLRARLDAELDTYTGRNKEDLIKNLGTKCLNDDMDSYWSKRAKTHDDRESDESEFDLDG
eukprot:187916_1